MSSHAEASIGPAADPRAKKPSLWTSLEIAKLAMSLATPLALFFLGVMVSEQQDTANAKRADAAQLRLDKKDEQAAKQQALAESSRIAREDKYRTESAQLERDLQEVAARREKALRDEAFRREEAVRKQQLDLARISRLAQKQVEFWDKLAPMLSSINREYDRLLLRTGKQANVIEQFREIDELFALYDPYITPAFGDVYERYKGRVKGALGLFDDPGVDLNVTQALVGLEDICLKYSLLRDAAASEIALASGLLPRGAHGVKFDQAHYDRARNRCDDRREEVYREGLKKKFFKEGDNQPMG
jgi:hypothetical protein